MGDPLGSGSLGSLGPLPVTAGHGPAAIAGTG